jgi:hypothetical protein
MQPDLFHSPRFTQREAITCTDVDNMTLDAWVRHGHIEPSRAGSTRLFSIADLVKLDMLTLLAKFGTMKPSLGKVIVGQAWDAYEGSGQALLDLREALEGRAYRTRWQVQRSLHAGPDGEIALAEEAPKGAEPSFDLILPVGTMAQRVFLRVEATAKGRLTASPTVAARLQNA